MKSLIRELHLVNEETIQFPILINGTGWQSSENMDLSVIETGPHKNLLSTIIKAIENAKELVCLQSFLIQDSELIDALITAVEKRNVRVFVLSSAEARLKDQIEEDVDFIKASYIKLLDTKFKNHFIHRAAEHFHAKYILIDPKTNVSGFLCTNNFTENGFVKNPELALQLNNDQCKELFQVFVYHFWEHCTDEQTETNEFDKVKPVNKFSLTKLQSILLTSPNSQNNSLKYTLQKAVRNAEKSISFSTFLLDKNSALVKDILDKAKKGVSVTLYCRPLEKQFNEHLIDLLAAGVQIFFHPLMHAKSLLIDGKVGFVYTANLQEKGLDKGLEVGILLSEKQATDLTLIHDNWKIDFQSKTIKSCKVKDLKEIEVFQAGTLVKKQLVDENQEYTRTITTVSDLISFFNKPYNIKNQLQKSLIVKLVAEIEELPGDLEVMTFDKFATIEIPEGKDKKTKAIIINESFKNDDIALLNEYREYKIFFNGR